MTPVGSLPTDSLYEHQKAAQGLRICDLEKGVLRYVKYVTRLVESHHEKTSPDAVCPFVTFSTGPRYVKVYLKHGGGVQTPHTFIDTRDGKVYGADGWKKPCRKSCGSVYSERESGYGVSYHGAVYLSTNHG